MLEKREKKKWRNLRTWKQFYWIVTRWTMLFTTTMPIDLLFYISCSGLHLTFFSFYLWTWCFCLYITNTVNFDFCFHLNRCYFCSLTLGLVMLLRGVDANDHCSWCHYLSCVPTSRWSCNTEPAYCSVTETNPFSHFPLLSLHALKHVNPWLPHSLCNIALDLVQGRAQHNLQTHASIVLLLVEISFWLP